MIYQALVSGSPTAEKQLAHLLYGLPFVGSPWTFGDVVEFVNPSMGLPSLASQSLSIPSLGNVSLEV